MKRLIISLIVLMSIVGLASAGPAVLALNPLSQNITVGLNGTYTLTLNTTEAGVMHWDTNDSNITARIDAESFNQSGDKTVGVGISTHILEVKPISGITLYKMYDISIVHTQGGGVVAKAAATAGVMPVPELSTIALTTAGILGLVMVSRKNRKN